MSRSAVWLLSLVFLAGCASSDSKTADAVSGTNPVPVVVPLEPAKMDILFVIALGAGGCQEAWALSRRIRSFVEQVQANPLLDVQAAAAPMNMCSDSGRFVTSPARQNPIVCAGRHPEPCLGDIDCENAFGPGWTCYAVQSDKLYNFNGSVNSSCQFGCDSDSHCCDNLCGESCTADAYCPSPLCLQEGQSCPYQCTNPGDDWAGCVPPPDNQDCPDSYPRILSGEDLKYLQCAMEPDSSAAFCASTEEGMKTAWLALNPDGPHAEQSAAFLRPDAHLMVIFASNDDDCSIHEDFCAPNDGCNKSNDEADCEASGNTCKVDAAYSYYKGAETKLCCGRIKMDYLDKCALLGDYKGAEHHELAYHPAKSDCQIDADCEEGWYCKTTTGQGKCRPSLFSLNNLADFYKPSGAPLFSLASPLEYYTRFMSLKDEPAMLHLRALVGDGRVVPDDAASLISAKCLGEEGDSEDLKLAAKLDKCVAYKAAKQGDEAGCAQQPDKESCEAFLRAKLECIRQCWLASKGYKGSPYNYSYVCAGDLGAHEAGLRYIRLADMFGPNGKTFGLCEPNAVPDLVDDIGRTLSLLASRTCLPEALEEGQELTISQIEEADGSGTTLRTFTEGPPGTGDYRIIHPTNECCKPDETGQCTGSKTMVVFNDPLDPDTKLEIAVAAQP